MEVICISSDDDDFESPKDKQNVEVITRSCYSNVQAKEENLCSENENKDVSRKRKNSDAKEKEIDKRIKLCEEEQDEDPDLCKSIPKERETSPKNAEDEKEKAITMKPQLVEKERVTVCEIQQDIFPMFISLCLQRDHSNDMKLIVAKLKRKYEQLDSEYAHSEEFANLLNEKRDIMMETNELYTQILEIMNIMKSQISKQSSTSTSKPTDETISNGLICNPSTSTSTLDISNSNKSSAVKSCDEEMDNSVETECAADKKKIRKLLIAMKECENKIKKLEEKEVDFNDEEDSSYMKLERYKERMVKLYNMYCSATGKNNDAGRSYLHPKHISATGIVKVDQAITSFINSQINEKKKSVGSTIDDVIVPDYMDILECITKCQKLYNLELEDTPEEIAKKGFIKLGEYLQKARRFDYWDTFSLFLERNKEEDPAKKNRELTEQLNKNDEIGNKRLNQVFEEFVKKQEEKKDEGSSSSTEDEESSVKDDSCCEVEEVNKETTSNTEDQDIIVESVKICKVPEKVDDIQEIGIVKSNVGTTDNGIKSTSSDVRADKQAVLKPMIKVYTKNCSDTLFNNEPTKKLDLTKQPVTISKKPVCKIAPTKSTVDTSAASREDIENNTKGIVKNQTELSYKETAKSTKNSDLGVSPVKVTTATAKGTEDNVAENVVDEEKSGQIKDKPLLKVRSFAKPPMTWKDEQKGEKPTSSNQSNSIMNNSTTASLLKTMNTSSTEAFKKKSDSKGMSVTKGTYGTLFTLTKHLKGNVIHVKNVTNTYVNTPPGQIVSSVNMSVGSTIIVPQTPSTSQSNMTAPKKPTILKIVPGKKTIVLSQLPVKNTINTTASVNTSTAVIKPK